MARQVQLVTLPGKRPRRRPSSRWRDYISDLAWAHLGDYRKKRGISSPPRDAAPATLPKEKAGMKMHGKLNLKGRTSNTYRHTAGNHKEERLYNQTR